MSDFLKIIFPIIAAKPSFHVLQTDSDSFTVLLMSKIRQIDYTTPRTLVSYNGRRKVRLTGRETRYKFSGILLEGVEDELARVGDEREDWQKSAFPLPWTDSPDLVVPDEVE